MRCGTGRIAAPDQDQFTMKQHLRRRSQASTNCEHDSFFSCSTTDSSFELGSAQAIPKAAIGNGIIDQSQSACITVWKDTLRPMLCDNVMPTRCDLSNSFIP